ncbi:MAG: hypothetical protein HAW62_06255 [Endozoicomonadaceae bacterium]|nr:hypothetical protein [Endozoicomonadaceae bacterium]
METTHTLTTYSNICYQQEQTTQLAINKLISRTALIMMDVERLYRVFGPRLLHSQSMTDLASREVLNEWAYCKEICKINKAVIEKRPVVAITEEVAAYKSVQTKPILPELKSDSALLLQQMAEQGDINFSNSIIKSICQKTYHGQYDLSYCLQKTPVHYLIELLPLLFEKLTYSRLLLLIEAKQDESYQLSLQKQINQLDIFEK